MSGDGTTAREREEWDIKDEHYRAWLDKEERKRREHEDVRARLAAVEARLDELEWLLWAPAEPPVPGAEQ